MTKDGDQQRGSYKTATGFKPLRENTLWRGFQEVLLTAVESQLAVLGRAVTRRSMPKTTLFELACSRKLCAKRY
ncbi:MAG: hypothetical protein CBD74_11945 [Saprospirales bacterium TMED214]|nr:MAG: hypothetical protein CBD74_11945 [Saprospirales bacterium TMED214]